MRLISWLKSVMYFTFYNLDNQLCISNTKIYLINIKYKVLVKWKSIILRDFNKLSLNRVMQIFKIKRRCSPLFYFIFPTKGWSGLGSTMWILDNWLVSKFLVTLDLALTWIVLIFLFLIVLYTRLCNNYNYDWFDAVLLCW